MIEPVVASYVDQYQVRWYYIEIKCELSLKITFKKRTKEKRQNFDAKVYIVSTKYENGKARRQKGAQTRANVPELFHKARPTNYWLIEESSFMKILKSYVGRGYQRIKAFLTSAAHSLGCGKSFFYEIGTEVFSGVILFFLLQNPNPPNPHDPVRQEYAAGIISQTKSA